MMQLTSSRLWSEWRPKLFASPKSKTSSMPAGDEESRDAKDELRSKFPTWPSKPQRLHVFDLSSVLALIGDVVMLALALAFAGLAMAAWSLHKKPIEIYPIGKQVEKACKLGPTLFPLLFAALAGRSLKVFGRYWAGKGTRLGVLEALTASQSVWSTVEMQIKLQQGTLVGLWLLALWCLSPLGGQASLRVLQRSTSTNSSVVRLQYVSTGPASTIFASAINGSSNARFVTALLPAKEILARHEDIFGNVKIPRWEALNTPIDSGEWKEVPPVLEPEDFSSLDGVHVVGHPRDRDVDFNLEWSYVSANCQPLIKLPYDLNVTRADVERLSAAMNYNFTITHTDGLMPGERAHTPPQADGTRTWFFALDNRSSLKRMKAYLNIEPSPVADSDSKVAIPRRLIFGALYIADKVVDGQHITMTNCTLRETHVEAAAFCPRDRYSGGCRTKRLRLSQGDRRPADMTRFDNPVLAERLSALAPDVLSGRPTLSSWVENFIYTSDTYLTSLQDRERDAPRFVDLSRVPAPKFSRRFSLVLNTYYGQLLSANLGVAASTLARFTNETMPARDIDMFAPAGQQPPGQPPGSGIADGPALSEYLRGVLGAIEDAVLGGLPFIPAATTATARAHTPVFECLWGWLATLLLAAAALFATGAASLALQLGCSLPPDVLRYVASMTYANPYFRTPPGGSTLDGGERTRLLRDVRVRIGDLRVGDGDGDGNNGAEADVGEVAFVAVDVVPRRSLDSMRFYA